MGLARPLIPALALTLLALAVPGSARGAPDAVRVTFQLNDALFKDRSLPGVRLQVHGDEDPAASPLAAGITDAKGQLTLELAPGRYFVSYERAGYITLSRSPTEVHTAGQLITTSLSMNLEAEGLAGQRRVKIILNWGSDSSDARDLDSHLAHTAGGRHVFYGVREGEIEGHEASLDVDDTDWGGPETVKLVDPPPGTYHYWVHHFSGEDGIGHSDVVVRVLVGDALAGEFRAPPGASRTRVWRPFQAIEVGPDLDTRIVEFSREDRAAGAASVLSSSVLSRFGGDPGVELPPREGPPWFTGDEDVDEAASHPFARPVERAGGLLRVLTTLAVPFLFLAGAILVLGKALRSAFKH